ncbi:MAG: hypothetical protein LC117_04410 [Bacteroidia bacterium]|nr:hypothetical protein [Bacteroidia bacterium]MCZ2277152.1 hypothetical protein [Bacteroidia bacterium]
MAEELITLLSLEDVKKASALKSKLEQEGIECHLDKGWKTSAVKLKKPIEFRIELRNLQKALQIIEDDAESEPK